MLAADRILRTLEEEAVDYVLIGAFAATIHGSALRTEDVDVCPARDAANLRRLARALKRLNQRNDAQTTTRPARGTIRGPHIT